MVKNLLLFSLLLALPACSLFPRAEDNAPKIQRRVMPYGKEDDTVKKRIIVLPFTDVAAYRSEAVRKYARDQFLKEINDTKRFVIISLADLPQDVEKYKVNNDYDVTAIGNMAKSLDIAAVVNGKILEIKAERIGDQVGVFRKVNAKMTATLQIKMISTRNGNTLVDETRTATVNAESRAFGNEDINARALEEDPLLTNDAIATAIRATIAPILRSMDKISWEGRIASVKGDRLYINAGRITGLQIGDILRVTEAGQEIYDPQTGGFVGLAPGRTKGTIELVNYFGKDGAIAVIHSGSGFQENDRVELYY